MDDVIALIDAKTPEATAEVIARTGVSPTQTDEARTKPFDQLTLIEKLNRFREEFVAHMKREIIFNPNHILEGLKQNDRVWDEVDARRVADPSYHKRMVIFSQLVGWAQRKAAEPVKQDIRQGTCYLTEQNEPRRRQSHFNCSGRNDYSDVSLVVPSVVDGVGYKFAAPDGAGWASYCAQGGGLVAFSKLISSKNSKLEDTVTQLRRACARKPERRCSVM